MLNINDLIGSWNLIEHSQINEDLEGRLIYRHDGTMSVHITGKFDEVVVLIAYSGTYFVEESYIIHKVEISDNPKRVGTEQRRYIKFEDDLMIFTEDLHDTVFRVVWKK